MLRKAFNTSVTQERPTTSLVRLAGGAGWIRSLFERWFGSGSETRKRPSDRNPGEDRETPQDGKQAPAKKNEKDQIIDLSEEPDTPDAPPPTKKARIAEVGTNKEIIDLTEGEDPPQAAEPITPTTVQEFLGCSPTGKQTHFCRWIVRNSLEDLSLTDFAKKVMRKPPRTGEFASLIMNLNAAIKVDALKMLPETDIQQQFTKLVEFANTSTDNRSASHPFFFEKQRSLHCGAHAINNMFQQKTVAVDFLQHKSQKVQESGQLVDNLPYYCMLCLPQPKFGDHHTCESLGQLKQKFGWTEFQSQEKIKQNGKVVAIQPSQGFCTKILDNKTQKEFQQFVRECEEYDFMDTSDAAKLDMMNHYEICHNPSGKFSVGLLLRYLDSVGYRLAVVPEPFGEMEDFIKQCTYQTVRGKRKPTPQEISSIVKGSSEPGYIGTLIKEDEHWTAVTSRANRSYLMFIDSLGKTEKIRDAAAFRDFLDNKNKIHPNDLFLINVSEAIS